MGFLVLGTATLAPGQFRALFNPEYPSEFEVMDLALASAVEETHRMFFPWTEVRELTFFNGKKGQCDLKPAYQALKFGDQERALGLSIASL